MATKYWQPKKIYKIKDKWIVLFDDERYGCWAHKSTGCGVDDNRIVEVVSRYYLKDKAQPFKIADEISLLESAVFASQCLEGKYENCLFWSADEKTKQDTVTCSCNIRDLMAHGCRCGAINKERKTQCC
jgi:hypothetical protein